jgi:hypothetical protein
MKSKLQEFAKKHHERILNTPNNPISMGNHSKCSLLIVEDLNE